MPFRLHVSALGMVKVHSAPTPNTSREVMLACNVLFATFPWNDVTLFYTQVSSGLHSDSLAIIGDCH
jgi:hypothetical protein